MQIDSPAWQLKQKCPCCTQGYLILHTCINCKTIVAICEEVGTIFENPFNISVETIYSSNNCPGCETENSFRLSKDFELIKIGLTTKDYE